MGRMSAFLWRQESYIRLEEGQNHGCVFGLLKLLSYQNVKKMLPHRKHGAKKRSKTNKVQFLDEEANPISVEWANPPETSSASKKSIKARLRELMAKEENSKRRVSDLPEKSEPERGHGDKSVESVDILEIFKVNKQIFLKILNDQDFLHSKARLTKSGSFPSVNSAQMRDRGPSKLEDKQREIWPTLKGNDSISGDGSQVTASKAKFGSMRRASSLTESMDRYSQLYKSSFNKEVKKNLSRSLKLVSEDDEQAPKFRRLSLPECDYESFLPNLEAVREAVECDPDSVRDSVSLNQALDGEISQQEQTDVAEEDEIGAAEDEMLPTALIDEEGDPEFGYVKLVLERSGFTVKEQTWVWYTAQQPVNPAVFEEIEKLKYSTKTEETKWERKLIFDLINEALMEIDERSYLYYPKPLSSSCRVHPIPKGHWLLEEVWAFVGRCLSWRPELDPTLDFAVAQDLHGRHGWMNLQLESECVALELEDMILDELLLDEILLGHS